MSGHLLAALIGRLRETRELQIQGEHPMPRPVSIPQQSRLLRCSQAARYLGIGTKAIRQLILNGQLPHIKMGEGSNSPFLLDVKDLDAFIEKNKSRS